MATSNFELPGRRWGTWIFVLIQVGIILLAVTNESLWIDEFWTAYFAAPDSFGQIFDLLKNPPGLQTPLHYAYYYFWGLVFQSGEVSLRLANLPLFVIGQLSLFWALRAYPRRFGYLFLAVCALHPMVWMYANEARPYIMMYAGAEMILAYILHMHTISGNGDHVSPMFSGVFVFGCILLLGASMLGGFWVFAAIAYVAHYHYYHLNWRYLQRGASLLLLCILLFITTLLSLYYLRSVLHGGGASRLSSTNVSTLLFDAYELMGLSGIGPGRLELRDTGLAALSPYWIWLLPAGAIVLATLVRGLQEAKKLLGTSRLVLAAMFSILPLVIVIFSGFAMHWRVLGRHMIAELPVLNLLFALGLVKLFEKDAGRGWSWRPMIAMTFLLALTYSACSLRFADRHRKDDYRAAAAVARQGVSEGKRVWWAADALGANYYKLPGEFYFMNELAGVLPTDACVDRSGVQLISNSSRECLEMLLPPEVVILSKPETFDKKGTITAYLKARNFVMVQTFPAFTIWRPSGQTKQHNK